MKVGTWKKKMGKRIDGRAVLETSRGRNEARLVGEYGWVQAGGVPLTAKH